MKTKDFEKKIQKEIDPDLNVRINPNHDDIAGVYWNDVYIGVAIPPQEIKRDHSASYTDAIGYPYKHISLAFDLIKGKLRKYKQAMKDDPDLFKPVVMEKDPKIVDADGNDSNGIKEL